MLIRRRALLLSRRDSPYSRTTTNKKDHQLSQTSTRDRSRSCLSLKSETEQRLDLNKDYRRKHLTSVLATRITRLKTLQLDWKGDCQPWSSWRRREPMRIGKPLLRGFQMGRQSHLKRGRRSTKRRELESRRLTLKNHLTPRYLK